ncbi:MAG: CinA family protein [Clostridia bacterium]|nr:CinA family protein [Clostridia bacterium]
MKKLVNKLRKMGCRISAAESCTGGLVSKLLTDGPGASEVFDCAVTTYSNSAKVKLLGVKEETLAKYGAVSEQTAREMAAGVLALSGADIAVSVTGLAGPASDEGGKPVGTVCIGIATAEKCYATEFLFAGSRAQIRRLSAKMACRMVFDELGIKEHDKKAKKEKKPRRTKTPAGRKKKAK